MDNIRGCDTVTLPDGKTAIVTEFDPNDYGGRDVKVRHKNGTVEWFYKKDLVKNNT